MSTKKRIVMRLGEYTQRRMALLAEINKLTIKQQQLLRPVHDMMIASGVNKVQDEIVAVRHKLEDLIDEWRDKQRRVKP